jgi:hypothetical protein
VCGGSQDPPLKQIPKGFPLLPGGPVHIYFCDGVPFLILGNLNNKTQNKLIDGTIPNNIQVEPGTIIGGVGLL